MPILLEPDQEIPIVLDRDKDTPKGTRPTFLAKACSARKQREMYKLLKEFNSAADADDIDGMFDNTLDQLKDRLIGWKNMGGREYSPETIEDFLTFEEMRELVTSIRHNQHVLEGEKKSSES